MDLDDEAGAAEDTGMMKRALAPGLVLIAAFIVVLARVVDQGALPRPALPSDRPPFPPGLAPGAVREGKEPADAGSPEATADHYRTFVRLR